MIEYENLLKLNKPFIKELKKSFASTLQSGWFILGKNVEIFEKEFAQYISLPISFFHTFDDIYKVIEMMNKF